MGHSGFNTHVVSTLRVIRVYIWYSNMAAVIEYCIIYYTYLCRQFWIDSGMIYVDCWHSLRSEYNHQFCVTDEVNDTPHPWLLLPSLCGTWWPIRMQRQTVNPDMIVFTNSYMPTSSWKRQFLWSRAFSERCSYIYHITSHHIKSDLFAYLCLYELLS
jgi:hypothetical protein